MAFDQRGGVGAAQSAFLIVQHADHDPAFQAEALPLIREAAGRGEASSLSVAYLEDRARVRQGRPQLYGTQYDIARDPQGEPELDAAGRATYLLPVVEGLDTLDARRHAVGLESWRDYDARMAMIQGRRPAERPRTPGES